jgi:hypothetical protein
VGVPAGSFVKLYRPGPKWLTWGLISGVHYRVVIDGADVGELWPEQVKTFQVTPGEHEVQLKRFRCRWRNRLTVTVHPGEAVELASASEWVALSGFVDLHLATAKDHVAMTQTRYAVPPPRNLGEQSSSP